MFFPPEEMLTILGLFCCDRAWVEGKRESPVGSIGFEAVVTARRLGLVVFVRREAAAPTLV